jgi:hypothetical protein
MKKVNRLHTFVGAVFVLVAGLYPPANAAEVVHSTTVVQKDRLAQQKVQLRGDQQHVRKYSQKPQYPAAGDRIRSALMREIWKAQHPTTPSVAIVAQRKPPAVREQPAPQTLQQRNRHSENWKLIRDTNTQKAAADTRAFVKRKKYYPAQVPYAKKEKHTASLAVAVPVLPKSDESESHSTTLAAMFLVVIAVCIALGGTFAVLFLASRQSGRKVEKIEEDIQDEPGQRTSLLIPVNDAKESVQPKEESSFDCLEEEESAIELAQRFHRGQGEMKFALNLQSRGKEHSRIEKLVHSRSFGKLNGNKKRLAKRFGIGNGEVDLAFRLQKFQSSQLNKSSIYDSTNRSFVERPVGSRRHYQEAL